MDLNNIVGIKFCDKSVPDPYTFGSLVNISVLNQYSCKIQEVSEQVMFKICVK